jgi:hypothetical protein
LKPAVYQSSDSTAATMQIQIENVMLIAHPDRWVYASVKAQSRWMDHGFVDFIMFFFCLNTLFYFDIRRTWRIVFILLSDERGALYLFYCQTNTLHCI